jgi:hypothetical protein
VTGFLTRKFGCRMIRLIEAHDIVIHPLKHLVWKFDARTESEHLICGKPGRVQPDLSREVQTQHRVIMRMYEMF